MKQPPPDKLNSAPWQVIIVVGSVLAATVGRWLLDPVLMARLPYVTYFVAVYFSAWFTGLWASIAALLLAGWAADFFFIAPRHNWLPHAVGAVDYLGAAMYFLVGGTSIAICEAMRRTGRRAVEQGERLRTTLASIGDAVVTTDMGGRITNLNVVAESLTGWNICEALGRPLETVFRIVNEQTRHSVENPVTRVLRAGTIVGLANHTVLIAKDGSERPIDDSAAPIRCADGEVVGCVLVFRDVTERRRAERELRESEARKSAMFQTALDCIISINHLGNVIELNPAAERTFGYVRDDVLNRELAELIIPPALRERHRQGLGRYLATGEGSVLNHRIEMPGMRADGSELEIELTVTRIALEGPPIFTAYLRDITGRKQGERHQAIQYAASRALAESATLGAAALSILQSICEHLSWDMGALWLVGKNEKLLRCAELYHQPQVTLPRFEAMSRSVPFAAGVGLPGRVWSSSRSAWISDVVADDNFPRARVAEAEGLHCAFGFPITLNGEVLGVIEFFSREIREPDENLLHMMTVVGSQLGQFIERKQAEDALRSSNDELRRFNNAAVRRELRMIELKKEINELCAEHGQQHRYPLDFENGRGGDS